MFPQGTSGSSEEPAAGGEDLRKSPPSTAQSLSAPDGGVEKSCKLSSRQGPAEPPQSTSKQLQSARIDLTGEADSPPRKQSSPSKLLLTMQALQGICSAASKTPRPKPCARAVSCAFLEEWLGADEHFCEKVLDRQALVVPEEFELSELLDSDQPMGSVCCPSTGDCLTLTVKDLDRLKPGGWLDADLINFVLCLLDTQDAVRHERNPAWQRSAFLPTYVWPQIRENMCTTMRLDISFFGKHEVWKRDRAFFPIVHCDKEHPHGYHWGVVASCRSKSTLTYLDPMGSRPPEECLKRLGEALNANLLHHQPEAALIEWKQEIEGPPAIPMQGAGDCGMNVLAMIDCLATRRRVAGFDSSNMASIRMKLRQLLCSCRANFNPSRPHRRLSVAGDAIGQPLPHVCGHANGVLDGGVTRSQPRRRLSKTRC